MRIVMRQLPRQAEGKCRNHYYKMASSGMHCDDDKRTIDHDVYQDGYERNQYIGKGYECGGLFRFFISEFCNKSVN
jgi:hypothetical protein